MQSALLTLSEVPVKGRDAAWNIRSAAIAADHACYRYTATLGAKNKKRDDKGLARLEIAGDDAQRWRGVAIAEGVQFTRELGNLPPNICNPAYLRSSAGLRRRPTTRSSARCWTTQRWKRSAWAPAGGRAVRPTARGWWC